jgi:hypothetical protein
MAAGAGNNVTEHLDWDRSESSRRSAAQKPTPEEFNIGNTGNGKMARQVSIFRSRLTQQSRDEEIIDLSWLWHPSPDAVTGCDIHEIYGKFCLRIFGLIKCCDMIHLHSRSVLFRFFLAGFSAAHRSRAINLARTGDKFESPFGYHGRGPLSPPNETSWSWSGDEWQKYWPYAGALSWLKYILNFNRLQCNNSTMGIPRVQRSCFGKSLLDWIILMIWFVNIIFLYLNTPFKINLSINISDFEYHVVIIYFECLHYFSLLPIFIILINSQSYSS